jgi:SAM-dependent methyltransferase
MSGLNPWKRFIDKTARKPEGKWAIKNYADPRAHYRSFRIIIEALALRPDDIYCEIGCGGGVLLDMAMSKVKEGVALDHSQAMVALSTEKNRKYVDQGSLEIHMGNAEQLPWDSNRFTACASANMFFFVERPEAMLSEVFRVLKPGGRFSMTTIGSGIGKITFGWLYKLRTYSDARMTAMLKAAGFANVRVKSTLGMMQVCYGEKMERKGG